MAPPSYARAWPRFRSPHSEKSSHERVQTRRVLRKVPGRTIHERRGLLERVLDAFRRRTA